jgi:hypothetical protein
MLDPSLLPYKTIIARTTPATDLCILTASVLENKLLALDREYILA